MPAPDRATAKPSSLPDAERGHGVFVTFYGPAGYDGHAFLTPDRARELREQIDRALNELPLTGTDKPVPPASPFATSPITQARAGRHPSVGTPALDEERQ